MRKSFVAIATVGLAIGAVTMTVVKANIPPSPCALYHQWTATHDDAVLNDAIAQANQSQDTQLSADLGSLQLSIDLDDGLDPYSTDQRIDEENIADDCAQLSHSR
jgi:hypothetical protein